MNFLLIQTAFIGDVILATPLVEKLRARYPNCEIDMVVRKGTESLLENNPHLHRVFIFDKKNKYRSLQQLVGEIRSRRYTEVFNLQRFFTSGLLTLLARAQAKTGFDKNPLSVFFTRRVAHQFGSAENFIHEVDRNLGLVAHHTGKGIVRPQLYPSESDFQAVSPKKPYVCIAPASIWFTKQFPAERWIELAKSAPKNYQIYLLGAKNDKEICNQIATQSGRSNISNLAGQLSFLQSAALMKHAAMNFVNDSAPLHLASSTNAPVCAVFCSTVPAFGFTPLSEKSFVVESSLALSCRPCGLHGHKACPEGHFKCADISIGRLLAVLK